MYIIENGQKRPIVSGDVFERLGYDWNDVRVIDNSVVFESGSVVVNSSISDNRRHRYNGKLIKYVDLPSVYLIEGEIKRPILNAETFEYYGYNWDSIILIEDSISFETGEFITIPGNEYVFEKDLELGVRDENVRRLQRYLNNNGFKLIESGLGSLGNETTLFGQLTLNALIRFQQVNNIFPANGYFGEATRSVLVSP